MRHPNDSKLRSIGEPSGPRFATASYPRNSSAKSFALRIAAERGHHDRISRNGTGAARLPLDEDIVRPTFRRERSALKRGVWPVAGCDEAGGGRSPGRWSPRRSFSIPARVPRGLDDSKKLDAETREKLYAKICASAQVAVAMAPPSRIDRDNILRASLWALARAVAALPVRPQLVFVDGRDRIEAGCDCQAVIGGDAHRRLDRGRLDRRQGDARPADGAAWRRASRLRLRAPQGLQRARAFRGARPARPDHPSSPLVFAGGALRSASISAEPDDPAANVLPLLAPAPYCSPVRV